MGEDNPNPKRPGKRAGDSPSRKIANPGLNILLTNSIGYVIFSKRA